MHARKNDTTGGIMKRTLCAAAILVFAVAMPVFANESNQPAKGPAPTFEQRQADILKMLDQRIAAIQEDKACVQAAKSQDDLKVCRQKHHAEMEGMRKEMGPRDGHGGPGGPGGPGGNTAPTGY
jgi:hypothetical protein